MERVRFIVEPCGSSGWRLRFQGEDRGNFDSQEAAIASAVEAAFKANIQNRQITQVLVRRLDDTFHLEWSSDRDSYPPKFKKNRLMRGRGLLPSQRYLEADRRRGVMPGNRIEVVRVPKALSPIAKPGNAERRDSRLCFRPAAGSARPQDRPPN
jgi:Uncharacterized protein conserved in bacteria (DUF2188)